MTIHYTNTSNPVDFPKLSTIDRLWGEALDRAVPDTYSNLTWTQVEKIKTVFAKLIVRECAELTLDYKSDAYYNGWLDYRDEIKKHFGVEE